MFIFSYFFHESIKRHSALKLLVLFVSIACTNADHDDDQPEQQCTDWEINGQILALEFVTDVCWPSHTYLTSYNPPYSASQSFQNIQDLHAVAEKAATMDPVWQYVFWHNFTLQRNSDSYYGYQEYNVHSSTVKFYALKPGVQTTVEMFFLPAYPTHDLAYYAFMHDGINPCTQGLSQEFYTMQTYHGDDATHGDADTGLVTGTDYYGYDYSSQRNESDGSSAYRIHRGQTCAQATLQWCVWPECTGAEAETAVLSSCNPGECSSGIGIPCDSCAAGKYKTGSATSCTDCLDCPAGTTSPAGAQYSSECYASCDPGKWYSKGSCINCDAGKYKSGYGVSWGDCLPCPSGSTSLPGATSTSECFCVPGYAMGCTDRLSNKAPWTDGSNSCVDYEENNLCARFGDDDPLGYGTANYHCCACGGGILEGPDTCEQCEYGKYRADGMSNDTCVACADVLPNSRASINNTFCECSSAHTLVTAGDDSPPICQQCATGFYKTLQGNQSCTMCPMQFQTTVDTGRYYVRHCVCAEGYASTSTSGTATCVACQPGKYQSSKVNGVPCTDCSTGGTTHHDAAWSPSLCIPVAGYYMAAENHFVVCPANTYRPYDNQVGADYTVSSCIACPGMLSSPAGSTNIGDCTCSHAHVEGTTANDCTCVAGFYEQTAPCSCENSPSAGWMTLSAYQRDITDAQLQVTPVSGCELDTAMASAYQIQHSGTTCYGWPNIALPAAPGTSATTFVRCQCPTRPPATQEHTCEPCPADFFCPAGEEIHACPLHATAPADTTTLLQCQCAAGRHLHIINTVDSTDTSPSQTLRRLLTSTTPPPPPPASSTSCDSAELYPQGTHIQYVIAPNSEFLTLYTTNSLQDCTQYCTEDARCTMFWIIVSNQNCRLYDASSDWYESPTVTMQTPDNDLVYYLRRDCVNWELGNFQNQPRNENCMSQEHYGQISEFLSSTGFVGPSFASVADLIDDPTCISCHEWQMRFNSGSEFSCDAFLSGGGEGGGGDSSGGSGSSEGPYYDHQPGWEDNCLTREEFESLSMFTDPNGNFAGPEFSGVSGMEGEPDCLSCEEWQRVTDQDLGYCVDLFADSSGGSGSSSNGAITSNIGVCLLCAAGTYSGNNACLACPANSNSPEGSDSIDDCVANAGYYGYGDYITICTSDSTSAAGASHASDCTCNPGFTGLGDLGCLACANEEYKPDSGSAICTSCPAHSTHALTAETSAANCACNAGYTGDASTGMVGACSECAIGTYKSSTGSAPCTACADANQHSPAGSISADACVCDAGFYDHFVSISCQACHKGKYKEFSGNDVNACVDCPTNAGNTMKSTTLYSGQRYSTACVCPAGAYDSNTNDPASCVTCSVDTYKSAGFGACESCPLNTGHQIEYPNAGASSFVQCLCNAGYSADVVSGGSIVSNTDSACAICPAGTYKALQGTGACLACPANSQSEAGADACACNVGFHGDFLACTECLAGKYKDATGSAACDACPADSNSMPQSTSIDACHCNAGYDTTDGDTCHACSDGKYKLVINDNVMCEDCSENSQSTLPSASTKCVCSAGFTGSATDGTDCTQCADGTYKPTIGSAVCTACADAQHKSELPRAQQTDCKCNAGYSGTDVACTACGNGEYKTSVGNVACVACVDSTHSLRASSSVDDCVCNAGFEGAGDSCTECAAGKYSEASVCVDCPLYSMSSTGQDAIGDCECNSGYIRSGDTCDITCGPGFEGDELVEADACVECGVGKYKSTTGSGACVDCPAGSTHSYTQQTTVSSCMCEQGNTPLAGETSDDYCAPCAAGKFNNFAGETVCYECNAATTDGLTCSDITAAAVPAGMGVTGQNILTCTAGTWNDGSGLYTTCQPCPTPSTNSGPEGATTESDCYCAVGYARNVSEAGDVCIECAQGYYKDTVDTADTNTQCVQCPALHTTLNTASTSYGDCLCDVNAGGTTASCVACSANEVKYIIANLACIDCHAGSSLAADADHLQDNCLCDAGFTGVGRCETCPDGTFKNSSGDGACTTCGANTISDPPRTARSNCACATNYMPDPDSYGPDVDGGSCVFGCGPGKTFDNSVGAHGACVDCTGGDGSPLAVGTFKTVYGKDACTACSNPRNASLAAATAADQCRCMHGTVGFNPHEVLRIAGIGAYTTTQDFTLTAQVVSPSSECVKGEYQANKLLPTETNLARACGTDQNSRCPAVVRNMDNASVADRINDNTPDYDLHGESFFVKSNLGGGDGNSGDGNAGTTGTSRGALMRIDLGQIRFVGMMKFQSGYDYNSGTQGVKFMIGNSTAGQQADLFGVEDAELCGRAGYTTTPEVQCNKWGRYVYLYDNENVPQDLIISEWWVFGDETNKCRQCPQDHSYVVGDGVTCKPMLDFIDTTVLIKSIAIISSNFTATLHRHGAALLVMNCSGNCPATLDLSSLHAVGAALSIEGACTLQVYTHVALTFAHDPSWLTPALRTEAERMAVQHDLPVGAIIVKTDEQYNTLEHCIECPPGVVCALP